MGRVVYLSGPMSGIEDCNRQAFHRAATELRLRGFVVLNPAATPDGLGYGAYMDIAMAQVRAADAVALLDGHGESPGSRAEVALARSLGKRVAPVGEFLEVRNGCGW